MKMTNKLFLSTLLMMSCSFSGLYAQQKEGVTLSGQRTGQPPYPIENYKELPNPAAPDMTIWAKASNLAVGWGSTDIRYKKEAPASTLYNKVELVGWKGERVAAQLVVSSKKPLSHLSFSVGDLIHADKKSRITGENVLAGFVRYVMTDELNKDKQGGCGYRRNAAAFDSSLVADPIDHLSKEIALSSYSSQGIWVRVWIPQSAKTGIYRGVVRVKDGSRILATLPLAVKVLNRTLPKPAYWSFHLDLWQNPYAIARYYRVGLWTAEHFAAMKPLMELYRDAGGKVITTSIIHKPWNGQTYDYYNSMIRWTKKLDGSWSFDYSVFDKWVDFMMNLGINKEINCYSMIPWRLSFQYFDEASNDVKEVKLNPEEQAYEDYWLPFLKDFAAHLKAKGWFDKTCISMDERPMKTIQAVFKVIRKADKDFKVSLAGALHEELSDELYDYCVALRMKYTDAMLRSRISSGKVTSFYTSCEEPHPNTFTFSDPAEAEWMGWYAAKAWLDGYLRWSLCHWGPEPLLDSRFYTWAAGDTYLIYPGARTSIRFERLVDGIQAFEKIRILKAEFAMTGHSDKLPEIDKMLKPIDELNFMKMSASDMLKEAKRKINTF